MISPANMTYDSLVLEIQQTFQRNDTAFYDNISKFIYSAEQQLAADVKDLGQLQYATTTGISDVMRKPEGWRQTNSIRVTNVLTGEQNILIEKTYEWCRLFTSEITSGYPYQLPEFYSDYNYNNYYLSYVNPNYKDNIEMELAYYAYPKFLSSINQTNYWTQYYPQLLLYSSLFFAAIFVRMDERAQMFMQMYGNILNSINIEDSNRNNDSAYEVKPSVQKVPRQLS